MTGLAAALSSRHAAGLMFALIDAAERDPAFAALHEAQAATRHAVILEVIRRGIARGELPADTDPREVLDPLAGPVFHRRAMRGTPPGRQFAERVVDQVLNAYRPAG